MLETLLYVASDMETLLYVASDTTAKAKARAVVSTTARAVANTKGLGQGKATPNGECFAYSGHKECCRQGVGAGCDDVRTGGRGRGGDGTRQHGSVAFEHQAPGQMMTCLHLGTPRLRL